MLNRNVYKYDMLFVFLFIISLTLVAGLRVVGNDPDSLMYAKIVNDYSGFSDVDLFSKEPGFWFIVIVSNFLFSNDVTVFFLMYSFLAISFKINLLRKISPYPMLSFVLYLGFYFVLHEMNQIRIGLASVFLLFSLNDVLERKKASFLVKYLFAVVFHYSTFFWAFVYFLGRNKNITLKYLYFPVISFFLLLFLKEKKDSIFLIVNHLPSFISFKLSLYLNLALSGELDDVKKIYFGFGSVFLYLMLVFVYLNKHRVFTLKQSDWIVLIYKITSIQLVLGAILLIVNVELSNRIYTCIGVVSFLLLPPFVALLFKQKLLFFSIFWLYAIKQLVTSINYILS